MYVESDCHGQIIIQDLTPQETSLIRECIYYYLSDSCSYNKNVRDFLRDLDHQLKTNTNG